MSPVLTYKQRETSTLAICESMMSSMQKLAFRLRPFMCKSPSRYKGAFSALIVVIVLNENHFPQRFCQVPFLSNKLAHLSIVSRWLQRCAASMSRYAHKLVKFAFPRRFGQTDNMGMIVYVEIGIILKPCAVKSTANIGQALMVPRELLLQTSYSLVSRLFRCSI